MIDEENEIGRDLRDVVVDVIEEPGGGGEAEGGGRFRWVYYVNT